MVAGIILIADVIKLCESDAFFATGAVDLVGGRNAWAGGTGGHLHWTCLGFTNTFFHIDLFL